VAGAAAGAALAAAPLLRRLRALDLGGRVAVVTGGSRGLGLCIAEELVREGARVVIVARDPEELAEADARLSALGGQVLALEGDVTVPADAEVIVGAAVRRFGSLDILVNNAGVITVGPAPAHGVAARVPAGARRPRRPAEPRDRERGGVRGVTEGEGPDDEEAPRPRPPGPEEPMGLRGAVKAETLPEDAPRE